MISSLEKKALVEEYGQAAGGDEAFAAMLKRATSVDYGFLYIVFGLRVRFFNSYRSEFQVESEEE